MTYRLPRRILYAVASAALLSAPARAEIDDATISYIEDQVEKGLYPGVMIALVEGDEVTYRAFGVANRETGVAPDADTVFEIGSVTKTFTGLLLARLARDGTLTLDDPVQQYLPEGVSMPQAGDRPMTFLDIATQRSGLPRLPADFSPADPQDPYADYDEEKLWASVNALELNRAPGESYEYSNFGYGLLGELIARAAGTSYQELLRSRILDPLGMTDTGLGITANMARGYGQSGDAVPPWTFEAMAGAGAIRSTARDMVKYLKANMGEAGTEALQEAAPTAQQPRTDLGQGNVRIGLAWMTAPAGTGHWHEGGTYGFHSFAGVDPEKDRAVLIWTNTFDIADPLVGVGMHLLNPDIPLPAPREARADHTQIDMTAKELAAYEGSYKMDFGPTLTIRLAGDQLMAQLTNQPEVPVYPEAPDRFFYKVVDAQLVFSHGEDGKVTGVTIHQNGQAFAGEKE